MDLCDQDAVRLRSLLTSREISPVELLEACIGRIHAVNPRLNAIVAECLERARGEAREAQSRLLDGRPAPLLTGLPIAIKDLSDTAGLRTTYGSPLFHDHVPQQDERIVARLRAQGAIVVGKTNTPEFGIGGHTRNRVYGVTRNPFAPDLSPGGSSGGAAVAVATGMVPLASGTDSGGSLRNPASFCGVVGFRPTPGRVPWERRAQGWSPMGVQGPMARTVADAALLLQAMAHHDPGDPLSQPGTDRFDRLAPVDLAQVTAGFSVDLGCSPVARAVSETFHRKIARLSACFSRCEPSPIRLDTAERASWILRCVYLLTSHAERFAQYPDALEPRLRDNLVAARRLPAADIAWALAEQTRLFRRFELAMRQHDVLICPAAGIAPFPADGESPMTIDGAPLDHYAHWMAITYTITLVGHPALVIPCGVDGRGLPFGIQLIARPHQDHRLLSIGHALEQALAALPELARPRPHRFMPGPPFDESVQ